MLCLYIEVNYLLMGLLLNHRSNFIKILRSSMKADTENISDF